jgi:hypothetical protein
MAWRAVYGRSPADEGRVEGTGAGKGAPTPTKNANKEMKNDAVQFR